MLEFRDKSRIISKIFHANFTGGLLRERMLSKRFSLSLVWTEYVTLVNASRFTRRFVARVRRALRCVRRYANSFSVCSARDLHFGSVGYLGISQLDDDDNDDDRGLAESVRNSDRVCVIR